LRKLVKLLTGPLSDGPERRPLFRHEVEGARAFGGAVYCENTKRSLSRSSATPHVKAFYT